MPARLPLPPSEALEVIRAGNRERSARARSRRKSAGVPEKYVLASVLLEEAVRGTDNTLFTRTFGRLVDAGYTRVGIRRTWDTVLAGLGDQAPA